MKILSGRKVALTPLARANLQKASKKQTGLARYVKYVKVVSTVTADARKIAGQRVS